MGLDHEVGGAGVEGRGLDLPPSPTRESRGGDVGPGLAGIAGHVHQTVVATRPESPFSRGDSATAKMVP